MSEVREASSVVTSENLAEFHAQKLGLATEAPIEAVVDEEPPIVTGKQIGRAHV